MKKILFITPLLLMLFLNNAFAQRKVQVEEDKVVQKYDRNSISVLVTTYSDNFDSEVLSGLKSMGIDEKFDMNNISTTSIPISGQRANAIDSLLDFKVNKMNIGRDIVAFWLNRDAKGRMDDSRMKARSEYNATEQEIINAQAAKVSTIAEKGADMIPNSYIAVFDVKSLTDGGAEASADSRYSVSAVAYIYQIQFSADNINDIYMNMWIYDKDNATVQAEKKAKFDNMQIPMNRVNKFSIKASGPSYEAAVANLFNNSNLSKMEKKIKGWQVKVPIYKVKPIVAKAGKKEGLRNGDRYRAYTFQEDKNGNLMMVKRGFVRVTSVYDNRDLSDTTHRPASKASGLASLFAKKEDTTTNKIADTTTTQTKKLNKNQAYLDSIHCSRFYQISGKPLKEGMLLQQNKDAKVGISAGAQFGGLSFANIRVDYLGYIHNSGIAHYGLVNFGFDLPKLYWQDAYYMYESDKAYPYLNFAIGYGCGLPVSKMIEFQPFILVGADMMLSLNDNSSENNNAKFNETSAWYADAGLRFSIMPVYHFQIYIQADYSYLFKQGSVYSYYTAKSTFMTLGEKLGQKRPGLGLSAGIRVTF